MAERASNSQSNPMSEYDFADIPDEISEPETFPTSNAVLKMDQHVKLLLRNYQLSDEIVERFAQQKIRFAQLSSLCNEDLELLGITDEAVQNRMLSDFRSFDGQVPNFGDELRKLQEPKAAKYKGMSVIDLIQAQLVSMNTLLAATIIKVGANQSAQSPGVVVNSSFNSPQLVLEMLHKLTTHTDEMSDLLRAFKDQREMDAKKEELERKASTRRSIIGSVAAASLLVGYFVAAKLRVSK